MKLEIELDLNKIDYAAINKQIAEKIDAMDLSKTYDIGSKISYQIEEQTATRVRNHLNDGCWSGLNDKNRREISDIIKEHLRDVVKPHVEEIFNQIPEDELNKLICDLLPHILVDMLSSSMKEVLQSYYCSTQAEVSSMCASRMRDMINSGLRY